jgi:nucleotide-binding universal stress UspA family protein
MKAVVGVDEKCKYRTSLSLLRRLNFQKSETYMVHVRKAGSEVLSGDPAKQAMKQFQGNDELEDAECVVLEGSPARKLLEFADAEAADLICATATHSGALSCLILGSVCRGLAIGARQSVLIAKDGAQRKGGIKAVFATDHSPYSESCADKLFSLIPTGLEDVTVLSVITPISFEPVSAEAAEVMVEEDERDRAEIESKTNALASRFQKIGAASRALVQKGSATEEIAEVMRETQADLLILGAQGHGFIDRLFIGSTSLQQVVSEPYSVLIVRAQ